MTFSTEVHDVVKRFVGMGAKFTSVDVANEIKRSGVWRRNSDVAAELRRLFKAGECGLGAYETSMISVSGSSKTATLYHLSGSDPDDYQDRDQRALGPSDVKLKVPAPSKFSMSGSLTNRPGAIASAHKKMVVKRIKRNMTTQETDATDISSALDSSVVMSKVVRSKERIKIAAPMVRKLGWKPGQQADLSRIRTHKAVKVGVVVTKEGRVSIPRKAVKWGENPVKVMLTDRNEIVFAKA